MPRRAAATQTSFFTGNDPAAALRHENDLLVQRIAATKRALDGIADDLRAAGPTLERRLAPLRKEHAALCEEIHSIFAELLKPKRHPPRVRKQVAEAYDGLCGGTLFGGTEPQGGASAPKPAMTTAKAPIRDVYRRLVGAVHPDQASEDGERARRTEIMKEVTVAYGKGDLARLLELERTVGTRAKIDDLAALKRTREELRGQLEDLENERATFGDGRRRDAIAAVVEDAEAEVWDLRAVRDHVRAFRDGKIGITRFMRGPNSFVDMEMIVSFVEEVSRPRRKTTRKR